MSGASSEEAQLLRQVLEELRALPGAIAAAVQMRAPAMTLRDDEVADLVCLVAEISRAIGDLIFTVADLVEHSRLDPALKAALERSAGGFDSRTPRRIGKRLQRAEGRPLQGYEVKRVGTERAGAMWRIVAISRL